MKNKSAHCFQKRAYVLNDNHDNMLGPYLPKCELPCFLYINAVPLLLHPESNAKTQCHFCW